MTDYESKIGFNISPLKLGTILNVETRRSVYQIEIVNYPEIKILGGMKKNGKFRFSVFTKAIFLCSVWDNESEYEKSDWIGKDMCMKMTCIDEKNYIFRSSPVIDVEIIATDESWNYQMEWK